MELLAFTILAGLFVFYIGFVLLFTEKESHFGPFVDKSRKVVIHRQSEDGEIISRHEQPVTLFDHIRRPFGVYNVVKEELDMALDPFEMKIYKEAWFVNLEKVEVWECPYCLSAWLALFPAAMSLFLFPFLYAPLIWGAVAAVSLFLHRFTFSHEVEMELEFLGDDTNN